MIPSSKQPVPRGPSASSGQAAAARRHGLDSWRGASGRPLVCLLAAMLGCLALCASPAFARQARLFAGTFGAATSSRRNPYPLTNPTTVAVDDSSHDVYVAEPYVAGLSEERTGGVEKFTSSGEFILMFGKGVNRTKVKEGASEVEQDLCTEASGDECGMGDGAYSPDESALEAPGYVAVDNSTDESKGDVYVATGEQVNDGSIAKFDSSGHLIASWGSGGLFDGASLKEPQSPIEGPFGTLRGLVVDSAGNLWTSTDGPIFYSYVTLEFRPDASFVTGWEPGTSNPAGLAIDAEGNLYFSRNQNFGTLSKFEPTGEEIGPLEQHSFHGIVVNPDSNELYVA